MPPTKTLIKAQRYDIIVQLRNYENYFEAARLLGLNYYKRPIGYFNKNENILRELKPQVLKLGRMFKRDELRSGDVLFGSMIYKYIMSVGGMDEFEKLNAEVFSEWGIKSVKGFREKHVPPTKKVCDKETGKVYVSAAEAASNVGVSIHVVRDQCNRPQRFKKVRFQYAL